MGSEKKQKQESGVLRTTAGRLFCESRGGGGTAHTAHILHASSSPRKGPILFFLVQTKMSYACSLHSTRDYLSESRFRGVQCYDDPPIVVVADLTRSKDWLSLKPGDAVGDTKEGPDSPRA